MKHPFDDFLPPAFHAKREDRRLIRIGTLLVAVILITTALAFATTLSGWRGLIKDRGSVSVRWDDANTRVLTFVKAQKTMEESIESAKQLAKFVDGVPRSIILWELTNPLPEQTYLDDIRLETRTRVVEEDAEEHTEQITLFGTAPNDVSISMYIDELSTSPYFTNVSLIYAQQEGETTQRKFSMQLKVNSTAILVVEDSQ
jgi:hypothetical protein